MPELVNDFIFAQEQDTLPTAKTKKWDIINKRFNSPLGTVYWMSPWRQYIFAPATGCAFNHDCLASISDFLQEANAEHRRLWERKRSKP